MLVALLTSPEFRESLQERGVPDHIEETKAAVELYNRLVAAGEHVGGLFHSTCYRVYPNLPAAAGAPSTSTSDL